MKYRGKTKKWENKTVFEFISFSGHLHTKKSLYSSVSTFANRTFIYIAIQSGIASWNNDEGAIVGIALLQKPH